MQQQSKQLKNSDANKHGLSQQAIFQASSLMSQTCESNRALAFLCMNHKCRQPAIICSHNYCQCINKHSKCRLLRADRFLESMLSRRKKYQERPIQWVQIIRKYIEQTIQELSRLRTGLDTFTQNYGWDATQVKLYELMNDNMTNQITGKLISMIHLKTKAFQQSNQQIANKKYYKRMWNYKYLKQRVSVQEISVTNKAWSSLQRNIQNIAHPGYDWLFTYSSSINQILAKCPLLPQTNQQRQAIAYIMDNNLMHVFNSISNYQSFSKVTQLQAAPSSALIFQKTVPGQRYIKFQQITAENLRLSQSQAQIFVFFYLFDYVKNLTFYEHFTQLNLNRALHKTRQYKAIQSVNEQIQDYQRSYYMPMIQPVWSCFKNLTNLNLKDNWLSKIQNLSSFKELIDLNLSENRITKIENLENLKKLQIINLQNNRIGYVQNLQMLTNLKILNIATNPCNSLHFKFPMGSKSCIEALKNNLVTFYT